ncbi:alpha-amylase family glycosyl hydrolase [Sphingomonas sp. BGYR3]|uniref:alpha-amylase family glycosyl hydrolase n=1 Tax=Sphingomonas sp. BGYR3 TaxID=2975483 RepID=UPI0021A69CFC|nr:alpha-amylase family glycosyl hydrolase [Sphingomonas sp. BGYR3]MDG5487040.1 alpha-amylase family glycosyl hydrolase [Sphingomonas sp. BGYR3]
MNGMAPAKSAHEWWRGAAIYQIYPRSFQDSNGDGVGDLPGITQRLGHVASLGVDAIWLSPFFTSPMKDFGYDVSDYCDVDPIFGTLDDFDALVARAHALGLKVIIDQVYSHTSDQHDWFAESRSSRTNAKADWYVWADARPDGSPPNNWQSVFGGPAWTWDARRGQYYLHNFLASQPQMHVHNREVQDALLATARFWLERGVDGFRVDAINFAMHDPELRDNPPAPDTGKPRTRPFDFQQHVHNQSHADIPLFLERLRGVLDEYGATFTVAEVGGPDPDPEMKAFTAGGRRLNSAYSFDFLYADRLDGSHVAEALGRWPEQPGTGWPSWAFENHDAPRAISRWASPDQAAAFGRMKTTLLACLRGNIFLYNGEELGLTQVDIAQEDLRDPEAIANWPMTLSRDGARTPMVWEADTPGHGFSDARPWLPFGPDHPALAVDRQERDPQSMLAQTRAALSLRNGHPALRWGEMTVIEASAGHIVFERTLGAQRMQCAFNLTDRAMAWTGGNGRIAMAVNGATATELPAHGAIVIESDR